MYLKSIELHGFKSFAGRIVLSFDDGITGIVGPNGSGKSNVADAVRWVLGEQSAKTLRGANMQDVIFSGTESRKALSFAYVCLTLDNSDHVLPLDFDEVSISRRIYRSGESEYQINKANCRLKDIQELFYDTGIGKEGYSIIGQGQVERILSSKPEDRREIFDEAVGIVKYKKRKEASLKRLQEEEDNLTRIEDVLSELTDRIGPLQRQAETAKVYLEIKKRQKDLDINAFLMDTERLINEEEEMRNSKENLSSQIRDLNEENEKLQREFGEFSGKLRALDEHIENLRENERKSSDAKGELGAQIKVLEERVNSSDTLRDTLDERKSTLSKEIENGNESLKALNEKAKKERAALAEVEKKVEQAKEYSKNLSETIVSLSKETETLNKELLGLKDERAEINSERQKYETRIEQININKASLSQRQLEERTKEEELAGELSEAKNKFLAVSDEHEGLMAKKAELEEKLSGFENKISENRKKIEEEKGRLLALRAKRETIKNIAERYEGYGGAVRHIMERKDEFDGVIGVVADLFSSEKQYETAIETALGGALQNIVTEDEESARACVDFLKRNKHGRVTFLPVSSVEPKESFRFEDSLNEKGAIGLASELVDCDYKFRAICDFLLGRILVAEDLDSALRIAKHNDYRMNIVTLEGEQLRPGGSITGGSFRNNSNLLGRSRELEELLDEIKAIEDSIAEREDKLSDIVVARDLAKDDCTENADKIAQAAIVLNTAAINLKSVENRIEAINTGKEELKKERANLEDSLINLSAKREETTLLLNSSMEKEAAIEKRLEELSGQIDENTYMEGTATRNFSEVQIEEANAKSEVAHTEENISRITGEIERFKEELEEVTKKRETIDSDKENNIKRIEEIRKELSSGDENLKALIAEIDTQVKNREGMQKQNGEFLREKDRIARELSGLEKEGIRLESKVERIDIDKKALADKIWEEYELTYHNAFEYRNEEFTDLDAMKRELSEIARKLRDIGPVNIEAIEEYANVSDRYEFLTAQCADLKEGRERLLNIIDELNTEMQERFEKGFAEINTEFDKVFKVLFGGGSGKLELSDERDILESGIRIIAQPPGKKLTNMMMLSGGEKSLTAIALLFAILNLKPSPFCLLDEIEAALDEQNVDRFAKYLNQLTEETQFIIITHRRGTMNAADRLYGITMQEKGISTLVSVNLIEDELDE